MIKGGRYFYLNKKMVLRVESTAEEKPAETETSEEEAPDTGIPDGEGRTVDIGAYESSLIFSDDFESGDTGEWSNVVGGS